ncbi:unnamed protein product [Rotaria sp. Silwood1]|nr:unnamed protein product [Rotaria sp. Silwood1]CAF1639006.1 unnamed protein product [Rotaria sp. Silwood1]
MTKEQRIFVLKHWWISEKILPTVNTAFRNGFPDDKIPTRQAVYQLAKKFAETGSVDATTQSGRPAMTNTEENVLSSSLAGLAIGATIIYRHPDYFLRVAQANMPGLDRLLAIVCTTTYVIGKITSTNFHAVYRNWRDYVRSIMVKYLPNYIDSSITDTSETDIVTVIKSSIYKIDIYENVWHKPEELNMIKESIQSQLEHLEKLKQGRSPQEDYFHLYVTSNLF